MKVFIEAKVKLCQVIACFYITHYNLKEGK